MRQWARDAVGEEDIPPDRPIILYHTANGYRAQAAEYLPNVEATAVAFAEIGPMLDWLEGRMQKWEALRGSKTVKF